MNRSPAIYTDKRRIAQRARRDAEAEGREPRPGPTVAPHGARVGWITFHLYGQEVTVNLLATGHHARSYGAEIRGAVLGVMGTDKAWNEVSKRVGRLPSYRSDRWL